jgi:phosphonate transport system substrate-binding protein
MSLTPESPDHHSDPEIPKSAKSGWAGGVAVLCVIVAIALLVDSGIRVMNARTSKELADAATVRSSGLVDTTSKTLASQFTDTQGRLLADPPTSPDKLVDPPVIVLAHLNSADPEGAAIAWNKLEAAIAKATGRKVVDEIFDNSADQLARINNGAFTLVALHAADTPFLVNDYGYQPIAVVGNSKGANGNHLDIIVPSDSHIAGLADLRGQSLTCTVPSSITGYRAAIPLLLDQEGLRPNVDYLITWSLAQKKSIEGIAQKEYIAAAVSDDKLQSLIDNGDVDQNACKIIYHSEVIPRMTIGWFFNLNPALAAQLKDTILAYKDDSAPSANADSDSTVKSLRFLPVDYKKDFQLVREIDDRFDPRLNWKSASKAPVAAAEPTTQP